VRGSSGGRAPGGAAASYRVLEDEAGAAHELLPHLLAAAVGEAAPRDGEALAVRHAVADLVHLTAHHSDFFGAGNRPGGGGLDQPVTKPPRRCAHRRCVYTQRSILSSYHHPRPTQAKGFGPIWTACMLPRNLIVLCWLSHTCILRVLQNELKVILNLNL
jgi:hypothetical protein